MSIFIRASNFNIPGWAQVTLSLIWLHLEHMNSHMRSEQGFIYTNVQLLTWQGLLARETIKETAYTTGTLSFLEYFSYIIWLRTLRVVIACTLKLWYGLKGHLTDALAHSSIPVDYVNIVCCCKDKETKAHNSNVLHTAIQWSSVKSAKNIHRRCHCGGLTLPLM